MHVLAAKVEALDIGECLTNPTKLAKGPCSRCIRRSDTDAITCACDGAIEIEALGARTDWSVYPPRVVAPPALEGLDPDGIAMRVAKAPRIAASRRGDTALGGHVPGRACPGCGGRRGRQPWRSRSPPRQVPAATTSAALEANLETAGRTVLESARQFLLAGANIIMVIEHALPEHQTSSFDSWKSVMTPIANLTRFHRALPMALASWTSRISGRCRPRSFRVCRFRARSWRRDAASASRCPRTTSIGAFLVHRAAC